MVTLAAACCKPWSSLQVQASICSDEKSLKRMLFKTTPCSSQHLLAVSSGQNFSSGRNRKYIQEGRLVGAELLADRALGSSVRAFNERGEIRIQAPEQEGSTQDWEELRRRASSGADASVSFSSPIHPTRSRTSVARELQTRSAQQKKKGGKVGEVNGHHMPSSDKQWRHTMQDCEMQSDDHVGVSAKGQRRVDAQMLEKVQAAFDVREGRFTTPAEERELRDSRHASGGSTITNKLTPLAKESQERLAETPEATEGSDGGCEQGVPSDGANVAGLALKLGLESGKVYDMRRSPSSRLRKGRRRGRTRPATSQGNDQKAGLGSPPEDADIKLATAWGADSWSGTLEKSRQVIMGSQQPDSTASAGQTAPAQRRAPFLQSPEDVVLSRGTDYSSKSASEKEAQRIAGQRVVKQVLAALESLSRSEHAAVVLERWRGQLRAIDLNQVVKELGRAGRWRRGLQVLEWMKAVGGECAPNQITYVSVLAALGRAQELAEAERLFGEMEARGLKLNVVVFNTMMSVYVRCERPQEALALFPAMARAGVRPDFFSYATAINACTASPVWLPRSISLFEQMRREGIPPDAVVYNTLIKACARGGQPGEAARIFQQMQEDGMAPTLLGYNTLLDAHAEAGGWRDGYAVLAEMRGAGFQPDVISFNTLVKACCRAGQLREGLKVLGQMRRTGLQPTVGTFTLLISACATASLCNEAAALFAQLKKEGIRPDPLVFAAAIDAAESLARVDEYLKEVTELGVAKTGPIYAALIRAHSRRGEVSRVEAVLVEARASLSKLDVGLYNAALQAYSQAGRVGDVVRVFDELERGACTADDASYTILMDALGKAGQLSALLDALRAMRGAGLTPGPVQVAVVVDAFGKAGEAERAAELLDEMALLGAEPGAAAYTSLLAAFARTGQVARCITTFRRMRRAGVRPSVATFSVLIDAFGRAERVGEAEAMLRWLASEGLRADVAAWTALLSAYGRAGLPDEAVECFQRMQRAGVAPDAVAYTALMSALQQAGRDADALTVCDEMAAAGVPFDAVASNLRAHALCRVKRVAEAEGAVEQLLGGGKADVRTVNALLEAYAGEGQVEQANALLVRMRAAGLAPDVVSYSAIITALGRLRRFDEAAAVFEEMRREGVTARLTRPAYEALHAIAGRATRRH